MVDGHFRLQFDRALTDHAPEDFHVEEFPEFRLGLEVHPEHEGHTNDDFLGARPSTAVEDGDGVHVDEFHILLGLHGTPRESDFKTTGNLEIPDVEIRVDQAEHAERAQARRPGDLVACRDFLQFHGRARSRNPDPTPDFLGQGDLHFHFRGRKHFIQNVLKPVDDADLLVEGLNFAADIEDRVAEINGFVPQLKGIGGQVENAGEMMPPDGSAGEKERRGDVIPEVGEPLDGIETAAGRTAAGVGDPLHGRHRLDQGIRRHRRRGRVVSARVEGPGVEAEGDIRAARHRRGEQGINAQYPDARRRNTDFRLPGVRDQRAHRDRREVKVGSRVQTDFPQSPDTPSRGILQVDGECVNTRIPGADGQGGEQLAPGHGPGLGNRNDGVVGIGHIIQSAPAGVRVPITQQVPGLLGDHRRESIDRLLRRHARRKNIFRKYQSQIRTVEVPGIDFLSQPVKGPVVTEGGVIPSDVDGRIHRAVVRGGQGKGHTATVEEFVQTGQQPIGHSRAIHSIRTFESRNIKHKRGRRTVIADVRGSI